MKLRQLIHQEEQRSRQQPDKPTGNYLSSRRKSAWLRFLDKLNHSDGPDHYGLLQYFLKKTGSVIRPINQLDLDRASAQGYSSRLAALKPANHPWLENMRRLIRKLGYDESLEFVDWCIKHRCTPWLGYYKLYQKNKKSKPEIVRKMMTKMFFGKRERSAKEVSQLKVIGAEVKSKVIKQNPCNIKRVNNVFHLTDLSYLHRHVIAVLIHESSSPLGIRQLKMKTKSSLLRLDREDLEYLFEYGYLDKIIVENQYGESIKYVPSETVIELEKTVDFRKAA